MYGVELISSTRLFLPEPCMVPCGMVKKSWGWLECACTYFSISMLVPFAKLLSTCALYFFWKNKRDIVKYSNMTSAKIFCFFFIGIKYTIRATIMITHTIFNLKLVIKVLYYWRILIFTKTPQFHNFRKNYFFHPKA